MLNLIARNYRLASKLVGNFLSLVELVCLNWSKTSSMADVLTDGTQALATWFAVPVAAAEQSVAVCYEAIAQTAAVM